VGTQSGASTSPNGRYLAFAAEARLTPDAVAGHNAYLYDADASTGPKLLCASCGPGDAEGGNALVPANEGVLLAGYLPRSVFDQGTMFFVSSAALVEGDTNGRYDVYEYGHGKLSLISSGRGGANAQFVDASPDGHDVLILTANRLLASDHDEADDLYDVRVDGGFPEPPAPPPCSGEGCRPSAAASPAATTPASTAAQGGARGSNGRKVPFSVRKVSARATRAAARTGRVILHVRTSTGGRLSATARARLGRHTSRIAGARKRVATASNTSLVLRFSTAARRQLADGGRLKVALRVRFSKASKPWLSSLTLVSAKHERKSR
jgi:hypothetical protein